jgi:hypothetical protein
MADVSREELDARLNGNWTKTEALVAEIRATVDKLALQLAEVSRRMEERAAATQLLWTEMHQASQREWAAKRETDQTQWAANFEADRREWAAKREADQTQWTANFEADRREWAAKREADHREWVAKYEAGQQQAAEFKRQQAERDAAAERRVQRIEKIADDIRLLVENQRRTMIVTAVTAVIATVLGVGSFNAALQSNTLEALSMGKDAAQLLAAATEIHKEATQSLATSNKVDKQAIDALTITNGQHKEAMDLLARAYDHEKRAVQRLGQEKAPRRRPDR